VVSDHRARVAHGRRLALTIVSEVAQVLLGRVGERSARAHHAGKHAALGLIEDVTQPGLRRALREVTLRWAAPLGRDTTDGSLNLPTVRQLLGAPHRAALEIDAEYVSGDRARGSHRRESYADLGTRLGHILEFDPKDSRPEDRRFAVLSKRPRQDSNLGPAD
jgi:hypothetical protein